MVTLQGSYTFNAPQDVVWDSLQDPDVLSKVLPGCERLDKVAEDEYEGELNIRVGPVQGTFKGKVSLSNIISPESYHLEVEGQGRPGYVKGTGDLKLEADGEQTTLHYTGEASLSGRIASVGQRLVDSSARSITRQGLESLDRQVQARVKGTEEPKQKDSSSDAAPQQPKREAPKVEPPSQAAVGVTVAKDVATDIWRDFSEDRKLGGRDLAVIVAALAAIAWMWGLLFGRNED